MVFLVEGTEAMQTPKRTQDTQEGDPPVELDNDRNNNNQADDEEDSDRSPWSIHGEKYENVTIVLSDIRRIVQCPICLGIIRKTRTVMECLHRFCRECIDKSMRLGNNECPACRTHCASRRSLRDDPRYDAFIASLYPDIDKYEEEELAFQEEEKARNIQIQTSISQTIQRQTEALSRKRTAKATAAAFRKRSLGGSRNLHPRRRRNSLISADFLQDSDENEDRNGNEGGKDSSSDERTENKQKKCKRLGGARLSQSSGAAGLDGGEEENEHEANKEFIGASPRLVGSSDRLSWGKGGIRSRGNGKNSRNSRISKLVDHLRNSDKNDDEWDIHVTLVSFDKQSIPSLKQPYLCCRPTLSVRHLREYIANQTALEASEVEICLVEELAADIGYLKSAEELTFETSMTEPGAHKLAVLREQDTLAEVINGNSFHANLVLVYRKKLEN